MAKADQKCFLANARPDPDFRYLSKAAARAELSKPIFTVIVQGRNLLV